MTRASKRQTAKIFVAAVLLCLLFCLAGCMPPNYSKDRAKEIAEIHREEAEDWFKNNKQQAKVKSCKAYKTGTDLYAAVTGKYTLDKKSYTYIYDYYNKQMYLSENYEAVCLSVEEQTETALGLDPGRTEFHFYGTSFYTVSENDDPLEYADPQGCAISSLLEPVIPAGDPDAFVKSVLTGDSVFEYYAISYAEDYPEYDKALYDALPNLHSVTFNVPVYDGFSGEYLRKYSSSGIEARYCRIRKFKDGLYCGYTCEETEDFEDILVYKELENGFSLEIPKQAKPILFTDKKTKFVDYFNKSNGEAIESEVDELYKADCPGWKDCSTMGYDLLTVNDLIYGYDCSRRSNAEGLYTYRIEK